MPETPRARSKREQLRESSRQSTLAGAQALLQMMSDEGSEDAGLEMLIEDLAQGLDTLIARLWPWPERKANND